MYKIFVFSCIFLLSSEHVNARPCARICNEVNSFCDEYDILPTINRDLPYSPLYRYFDVCLRGHEWYSLETLYLHSGIWSYHKGVSLEGLTGAPQIRGSRLRSILHYYRNLPGDFIEWEDDLEFIDNLEEQEAINVGGSLHSIDVLYAAYRVLRSAAINLEEIPETENTQGHLISGGFRLLEGAMYLSTIERDEDAYVLASGTRDCIIQALIDINRNSMNDVCLTAMRDRLDFIWNSPQNTNP